MFGRGVDPDSHSGRLVGTIILLGAVTCWPIAVFWEEIRFHPARFTEEWLKLLSTGVVLYFLLQLVDEMRRRSEATSYWRKLVAELLLEPLDDLRAVLGRLAGDSRPLPHLEEATRTWKALKRTLDVLAERADRQEAFGRRIERIAKSDVMTVFNSRLLSAYATVAAGGSISEEEIGELLEKVDALMGELLTKGGGKS